MERIKKTKAELIDLREVMIKGQIANRKGMGLEVTDEDVTIIERTAENMIEILYKGV